MNANFWLQKWEQGQTAFHEGKPNEFLVDYLPTLNLSEGSRLFLPLCGKTRDIAWLLQNGYRVAGAELSELAVQQLFTELQTEPDVAHQGELKLYRAPNIDIHVGDFFHLTASALGAVDAIYDRAALVALPLELRPRYASHLQQITAKVPQLLITYEYNQQVISGPPFSVSAEEVQTHYATTYKLTALRSEDVPGGMKGKTPATETAWLLQTR